LAWPSTARSWTRTVIRTASVGPRPEDHPAAGQVIGDDLADGRTAGHADDAADRGEHGTTDITG
jgi:hypothetical protein